MYPGRYWLLARYFWQISCLLAISGRSAACSLFLADQRQRYYSIMSVCTRARAVLRDPTHIHVHVVTKYWQNLSWWCVHNQPNHQIKFPTKFSGHTVVYLRDSLVPRPCRRNDLATYVSSNCYLRCQSVRTFLSLREVSHGHHRFNEIRMQLP